MGFFSAAGSRDATVIEPPLNRDATAMEPGMNRDTTAIEPGLNRDTTGLQSRLPIAEPNHNQNQNHNHNQNHLTPLTQPTQNEVGMGGAVALSIEFRKHGIKTQPANPVLIEMAAQGVMPQTVAAACEEAKRTKPDAINLGYVKGILARWAREAQTMNVAGAQARQQGNSLTAIRAATIAGLTGGTSYDAANTIIDITPAHTAHLG